MNPNPRYTVTLLGQSMTLQVELEEAPTKKGLNFQFVLPKPIEDPIERQEIANKISVALQKRFGASNIAIDYNERNPYKNVVSFIVPIKSVSDLLVKMLKTKTD